MRKSERDGSVPRRGLKDAEDNEEEELEEKGEEGRVEW